MISDFSFFFFLKYSIGYLKALFSFNKTLNNPSKMFVFFFPCAFNKIELDIEMCKTSRIQVHFSNLYIYSLYVMPVISRVFY